MQGGKFVQRQQLLQEISTAGIYDRKLHLSFKNKELIDEDLPFIVAYINKLGLVDIDLSGNKIGPAGARLLASTNLKKLNLSNNEIGNDGARELSKNSTIADLNVENNNITADGVESLVSNPNIKILGIMNNPFLEEGANALIGNKSLFFVKSLGGYLEGKNAKFAYRAISLQMMNDRKHYLEECKKVLSENLNETLPSMPVVLNDIVARYVANDNNDIIHTMGIYERFGHIEHKQEEKPQLEMKAEPRI